jgi:release factor glutamine methyltransferase
VVLGLSSSPNQAACALVISNKIWFAAVPDKQFDLIISNPPYIEQDDPCLKDLIHEPQTALVMRTCH